MWSRGVRGDGLAYSPVYRLPGVSVIRFYWRRRFGILVLVQRVWGVDPGLAGGRGWGCKFVARFSAINTAPRSARPSVPSTTPPTTLKTI